MKTLPTLIAVSGIALLSACTLGPDFQPPAAPATDHYAAPGEASELQLGKDQHVALGKEVSADWWTLFHNPALNRVITRALAGNQDIAAARARVAAAREDVTVARSAGLPEVSLGVKAGRQKYGVALFGPADFSIPAFTYYTVGPDASLPLDLFGGTRRAVEAKAAYRRLETEQLKGTYLSLAANVTAQALNIARARDQIRAVRNIIRDDRRNVDLVKKVIEAGAGTRSQLLTAKSQLASDRTLLPDLVQEESTARHAMAVLVGKAPADWKTPDFNLDEMTLPDEIAVRLPSELVHTRPDILAAEAKLHMASAEIGVATANLYPHIVLTGNLAQQALTPGEIFSGIADAWSIAANLTQPLFEGGRLKAKKRAAVDAYQEALADYRQVVLKAFGQVADYLQALKNHAAKERAQRAAVHTANDALEVARKGFQLGDTGILNVVDAERRHARAQLGLSRARSQRYLDVVALYWALGGTLPGEKNAQ